jgi:CheY-like chemotaxis protein
MRTDAATRPTVDVLIADDDPALRVGMRLLLEGAGYSCAEAEEGEQAVELARRQKPRCVFLDLAMPALDGFSVARLLRSDPGMEGVHLNCLTGLTDRRAREQALLAGCENFLTKPVDVKAVLDVVRRQVERQEAAELSGLTKVEAEVLLDWLETRGSPQPEVSVGGPGGTFTVRWASMPGAAPSTAEARAFLDGAV